MLKAERRWEYDIKLTFNGNRISKLTITDHYLENHPDITNELIINLISLLDGIRLDASDYQGNRQVFK